MKIQYDKQPQVFEDCNNGSYAYNFDIEEIQVPTIEKGKTFTQWECEQVKVFLPLSANKITEAVISDKFPKNYEAKLINEYNSATLGIIQEPRSAERIKVYKDFLTERQRLKEQVDKDFADFAKGHKVLTI